MADAMKQLLHLRLMHSAKPELPAPACHFRGENDRGQLGPSPDGSMGYSSAPVKIPGTQRFASISAGVRPFLLMRSHALPDA